MKIFIVNSVIGGDKVSLGWTPREEIAKDWVRDNAGLTMGDLQIEEVEELGPPLVPGAAARTLSQEDWDRLTAGLSGPKSKRHRS